MSDFKSRFRVTDYATYGRGQVGFIVEAYYDGDWRLYDWCERNMGELWGDLDGAFATREEAQAALDDYLKYA